MDKPLFRQRHDVVEIGYARPRQVLGTVQRDLGRDVAYTVGDRCHKDHGQARHDRVSGEDYDRSAFITGDVCERVVDAAYEQRSLALSSNLDPSGFDELMPKTIPNATVDRLLHRRSRRAHWWRLDQAHPSHQRQRGKAIGRIAGQICWPSPGISSGRGWAFLLSVSGQKLVAIDTHVPVAPKQKRRRSDQPSGPISTSQTSVASMCMGRQREARAAPRRS